MFTKDQQPSTETSAPRVYRQAEVVPAIQLLTVDQIILSFSISRATFAQWQAERGFPRPMNFGHRSLRWKLQDVEAWIEAQRNLVNAAVVDATATDLAAKEIAKAA